MYFRNFFFVPGNHFLLVHEDPPIVDPENLDPENLDPDAETDPSKKKDPKTKLKVPLTDDQQQFVNSLLAEEKRKAKKASDQLVTQLETIKNKASTSEAEKEALELRIEDIKNSQLTADELKKKEVDKDKKKLNEELKKERDEKLVWKDRFTNSTIERSIVDAAITNKAFNPQHIVSILTPKTRLVEELDDDGKPTGQLIPKVDITVVKEGKPTKLQMAVTEAVKHLSEQEEHEPLFNSGATGGLGGNPNNPRRKSGDPDEIPTDPTLYQAWRKKNPDKVGGTRRGVVTETK